jgi:hypothetical protein
MFELNEMVVVCKDIPGEGLVTGDVGSIYQILEKEGVVVVEFINAQANPIKMAALMPADLKKTTYLAVMNERPFNQNS